MGTVTSVAHATHPMPSASRASATMYADEVAGGALYRGLAEYARRRSARGVPPARRRGGAARRALGATCCDAPASRAEGAAPAVPRARAVLPRPSLRHRGGAADHAAHRGGRGRPLPGRRRGDDARWCSRRRAAGRTIAAMQGVPDRRAASPAPRADTAPGSAARCAPSVFGVNDGLVSNFSLVMGVAGGTDDSSIVLLAGIAGLVAGAFSMASGEWISVRSQRELYENELRIEREELAAFPEEERDELEMIYRAKGVSPDAAHELVDNIMDRDDVALDTLARGARARPVEAGVTVGRGGLVVPRVRARRVAAGAAVPLRQRHRRRPSSRRCSRCSRCSAWVPPRRSSPGATPAAPGCAWPLIGAVGRGRHLPRRHRRRGQPLTAPTPSDAVRPRWTRTGDARTASPRRGTGSRSPRRGSGGRRRGGRRPSRR